MEYLHASLILHSAGKKVTEKAVTDILTAAGVTPEILLAWPKFIGLNRESFSLISQERLGIDW